MGSITMQNVQTTAAPKGWKVSTAGKSLDILSRQWIARPADERVLSLDDLIDFTKARAERTEDVKLGNKQIEIFSPEVLPTDDRKTALAKTQQLLFGLPGGKEVA